LPAAHAVRDGIGKITLLIIPPVSDQPDLLFLLHDIARLLRVAGDRRARAHGMTRAQWVILWQLERQPGLSQKQLSENLEVEPITVARLVDRLAARGMVERRDDPADRRIWRLHLLAPAFPVLDHMRGERDEVAGILVAGVLPQSLETVRQSLIAMKANVGADLRAKPVDASVVPPEPPSLRPTAAPAISPPVPARPVARAVAPPVAGRKAAPVEPEFQQDHP